MNKYILIIISAVCMILALPENTNAQSANEETDFMQAIFGMEKKAALADFIQIEDSNPFWTLYDEYETKRKELGKQRIALLTNYVDNFDKLTEENYDEIISEMIKLRKSNDKLTDSYYKKMKKVSGAKVAAQFFQVEAYFLSQIRATIMEEIPYIGAFDK